MWSEEWVGASEGGMCDMGGGGQEVCDRVHTGMLCADKNIYSCPNLSPGLHGLVSELDLCERDLAAVSCLLLASHITEYTGWIWNQM